MSEVSILYFLIFLSGFALAAAALPALAAGFLYNLAGEMETDFWRSMSAVRHLLRRNSGVIHSLLAESRPFRGQMDEPFAKPVRQFNRSMNAAEEQLLAAQAGWRRLRQRIPSRKADGQSPLQKIRLGAGWAITWIQGRRMYHAAIRLNRAAARAASDFGRVRAVWESVRGDVQKMLELQAQAGQLLAGLNRMNMCGASFDEAAAQARNLQRVGSHIPETFRGASARPPARTQTLNIGEVKGVYQRAQVLRQDYARLIQQLAGWQNQVEQFQVSLAEAHQALGKLYTAHSRAARNLDIHELVNQIFELNRRVRGLDAFAARPNVEGILRARQDCRALKQDALILARSLEQVTLLYNRWKNALEQARLSVSRLKDAIEEQETRQDTHPIRWDETHSDYMLITGQLKMVEDHFYKIRPEQMGADIPVCSQIKRRAEQRRLHCTRKAESRQKLLSLWADLQGIFDTQWIAQQRQLDTETRRYAAENWDPALAVRSFLADGLALAAEIRAIIPADKKSPLAEEDLDGLISRSQQAIYRLNSYQNRVEKIRVQMEQVWDAEREAGKTLAFMLEALGTILARFDHLGQIRMDPDDLETRFRQQIAQAKARGVALGADLNRREAGTVFAKRREIEAWAQAAAGTCQETARAAGKEAARHREGIRSRVRELLRIARLSGDPLVVNANRILDLPERSYTMDAPVYLDNLQKASQMMEAAGEMIETNLVERAAFKLIESELEELLAEVRGPAREVLDILAEFRDVAQSAQALDHGSSWPPTFIDLEKIRTSTLHLKSRHDEVVQASTRADLRSRYANLKRECLTALQTLREDVHRAQEMDQTVRDAGSRVEALLREKLAAINDGLLTRDEITTQASELLRRWETLNRRWGQLKGGGFRGMSYAQILRSLTDLEMRLEELV